MKRICILIIGLAFFYSALGKDFKLDSPDQKIKAVISVEKNIQYSLFYKGNNYLLPSSISMALGDRPTLGIHPVIRKSSSRSVSNILKPLYGMSKEINENYNELRLDFKENYSITFRVYNEGFAWRFSTDFQEDLLVSSEQSDFLFADNYKAYFHPSLSEAFYRVQKISDFQLKPNYSSLPVLVKTPDGTNILIHESDVFNYPCLTLSSSPSQEDLLTGNHSAYPKSVKPGGYNNFNLEVTETEKYIAKTTGKRDFPWRLISFAENDKDILNNQLVYLLASDNRLADVSWIKPGKVAWDWWNSLNLSGVDFSTGFNTETYKYFIDFAAANKIEYVNLDEGWSDQFDLLKVTNKLDMEELVRYAKAKHVGLILWCVWRTLDSQMTEALLQFDKWGIAGLKVDFMDRDDQVVVEFHERLLKEAAKYRMLVNYHGAYHPTGMSRTYPNNINVEGVRGLEWDKFNPEGTTPGHDVTIPFIRMFAGSMDYTPGAMGNYNKQDWKQIFDRPVSQGTRCHQLGMYVVYYAPLQMLSDAPTSYEKEPEVLHFLSQVPTTWDNTIPLEGAVGEHVCVARQKGNSWYVGSLTNWDARKLDISLDFLEDGKSYEALMFTDGPNAARVGSDYKTSKQTVRKGDKISVNMAPGGGFAAKITYKTQQPYNIVMFGNSITANGNWETCLNRKDVKNSGTGGFTTSHFVWIISDKVLQYQPKICFLEGGINDIGVGIPLERICKNYESLVDTLLSHKIIPVLQSTLFVNFPNNEKENIHHNQMVESLNIFLQNLASSRKIEFLDLNKYFSDNKKLKKEFTTDGVHVNEAAYKIWYVALEEILGRKGI